MNINLPELVGCCTTLREMVGKIDPWITPTHRCWARTCQMGKGGGIGQGED